MTDDPFAALTGLLIETLAPALHPAGRFIDLMHQDIRFSFPYAPRGFPQLITGRDALSDYLAALGARLSVSEVSLKTFVANGEKTQAVLEFRATAVLQPRARVYQQGYVSIVALSEGKIIEYRDYWNPLIVLETFENGDGK